jgi:para-nitrobenzyl esterase
MNRLLAKVLAATVACGLLVAATPANAANDTVQTENGPVRGTVTQAYRSFEGIPYAAPPVGERRWKSPAPPAKWTTAVDGTKPGNTCPQTGDFIGDKPSDNEDCLTLNVTAPRNARKLPVMVWIHGGGFFSGSGGIYSAGQLATQGDVVVVSVNYRLGVFGFLASDKLAGSGNYGLEDQQAALRWVQRNVAKFGGDPGQVTLFGESAGGISTCSHLAAPGSAGLFQRAIIQSGPCAMTDQWPYQQDGNWVPRSREVANQVGAKLLADVKCGDIACLRTTPVADLLAASMGGNGYGPVYGGGGVLPISPVEALATGRFHNVPVIQGTTRDEHQTFQAAIEGFMGRATNAEDYNTDLDAFFGARAPEIKARYPLNDNTPGSVLASVWTDYAWTCPAIRSDKMLARHTSTYTYEFADTQAPWFADTAAPSFQTGAYHAAELQYLFPGVYGSKALPAPQQKVADQMISYWSRFAHTGNPNSLATPYWPESNPWSLNTVSLAPGKTKPVDLAATHQCGFWDTFEK